MEQKSDIIPRIKDTSFGPKGRWILFFSVMAALGITIYGKPLYALGVAVLHRYGSSHGLFVPFISAYLIWLKLDKIKRLTPKNALLPGSAMAVAGFLIYLFNRGSDGIALPVLSFLLVAAGFILLLFGKEIFKEIGFPLFFLGAMIPLPASVYTQIADWMRQINTWGAVILAKSMGVPIFRDDFDIFLPKSHLHVDYSCSAIRYLLSYLVFGVAYAFRFKQSFKGRALVVAGAVPLSILGGVLRLSVIFASGYYIGPIMVEHNPHVMLSWTVFMVLLVVVVTVDRYLSKKRLG